MQFVILRNKLEVNSIIKNNKIDLNECNIIPITPHVVDILELLKSVVNCSFSVVLIAWLSIAQ